jgi:hypothetical protein
MVARKINWGLIMGIPGSLGALIALWILLGFPTVATSSDIQRLDRRQADTAVEVYQNKTRNIILNAPAPTANAQTQRLYEDELNQARSQLKRAEDRKIELSR